ncbi:D-alanine aminotransferase [Aminobacter aminovorans]|uniref:Probable branched-chain-amino-acid aminotransferase n=1 Tax=Aminobacter aminovorans TaxID=83263 RepID=A0A380WG96_AMIAI|nr:D-amino-acid transaminase [Aminobacter aminovorans]TCS27020.1 D-alanine aminotransferase [Aminobacter aminovorans]SUU87921.1 D-alanine aminotransferase [Aminobacter aminovorans]
MAGGQDRIVWLNGSYLPAAEAKLSIFDRGFLFADGIYEVTAVLDGKLVDSDLHMARLERSARELGLRLPITTAAIEAVEHGLIERNGLQEGLVYLQLTRGAEERNFLFGEELEPTLLLLTQPKVLVDVAAAKTGIAVKTVADLRWARRDIKSVSLLPQVLAKRDAKAVGCDEAWMVEDGHVSEGASSTAYIVTHDGKIVSPANSQRTLPGCTRQALVQLAEEGGLTLEQRRFTVEEAQAAAEAFITSASTFVMPVTRIDGKPIGDGKPGPVVTRLREIYVDHARAHAR